MNLASLRHIGALLLVILLSGCLTPSAPLITSNSEVSLGSGADAYVMIGVTENRANFAGPTVLTWMRFDPSTKQILDYEKNAQYIPIVVERNSLLYDQADMNRNIKKLFVVKVPVGEYIFFSASTDPVGWNAKLGKRAKYTTYMSNGSHWFHVNAGDVLYIGDYSVEHKGDTGPAFRFSRDIEWAQKSASERFPSLADRIRPAMIENENFRRIP